MKHIATITSKRQLTVPAELFRIANLKEGQKLFISYTNGVLTLEPGTDVVDRLAGSVDIPKTYRGLSPDQMIAQAKKEHFKK